MKKILIASIFAIFMLFGVTEVRAYKCGNDICVDQLFSMFVSYIESSEEIKELEKQGLSIDIIETNDIEDKLTIKTTLEDTSGITHEYVINYKYTSEDGILSYVRPSALNKDQGAVDFEPSVYMSFVRIYSDIIISKVSEYYRQDKELLLNKLSAMTDFGYEMTEDGKCPEIEKYNSKNSFTIEQNGIEFEYEPIYSCGTGFDSDVDISEVVFETYKILKINLRKGFTIEGVDSSKNTVSFIESPKEFIVNKNKDLTFKIDASYDLFDKVYIDGKELEKSNYISKSGSTIIILNDNYTKNLKDGNHTLKVTFTDGKVAETTFKITQNIKNPETGINMGYVGMILLIIIGISSYLLIRKYSKFPRHN